jgi:DNA-binding LytR/AlgR family response regulator
MEAVRVAICDDEPSQLDLLERCIFGCGFWKHSQPHVSRFSSGRKLVRAVAGGFEFAYIFLDIQMPGESGIDVCRELNAIQKTPVIFVSAHMEKQPEIDDLHPAMLLSKPYTAANLRNLLLAFNARRDAARALVCKTASGETRINIKDILYIKGSHGCNEVYKCDNSAPVSMFDMTLKQIAEEFSEQGLFRCSKSYVVNLRYYGRHTYRFVYLHVDHGGNNRGDAEIPLARDTSIGRAMIKRHLTLFGGEG